MRYVPTVAVPAMKVLQGLFTQAGRIKPALIQRGSLHLLAAVLEGHSVAQGVYVRPPGSYTGLGVQPRLLQRRERLCRHHLRPDSHVQIRLVL